MAERSNGIRPYIRRTHGSGMRGVFPVPSSEAFAYQGMQSRRDREQMVETVRQQYEARRQQEVAEGLGNASLPAFLYKKEIIETLENNQAIILGGETGSGKSTQVPQFLYEAGYDKTFVLVPRRVIADGLGDRIREEMASQLGEEAADEVGIIHGERVDVHDNDRIVVMTPDTFNGMEQDIVEKYGDKRIAIMSDEIHEANLFTEIATGVAALAVKDHPSWRLIAASATHNASTLTGPFGRINGGEVPVVNIEGRPFDVELIEDPEQTPMQVYASLAEKPDRAMIFTSGKREIDYIIDLTKEAINKIESKGAQGKRGDLNATSNIIFRKLHGELTEFELSHVNDPVPEGYKLVIVSSPAGMSGITISGLTHVITDGTINRSELDDDGVPGLSRRYLSKAGVKQQIGRAGRDVPGGVGILAKPVTIEEDSLRASNRRVDNPHMPFITFEDREEHEPAEIYNSNLGRVVLRVASLDRRFSDINEYIPHRVAQSSIISAEESLYRLGAVDDEGAVTGVGRMMNKFPLSPEISRGLVEAQRSKRTLEHLAHAALIATAIDTGGLQKFSKLSEEWKKLVRSSTADDFIAQDDMFRSLLERGFEPGSVEESYYLAEYDLHPKKVERARKTARKALRILGVSVHNIDLVPLRPDEENLIRRDFTAGMIDLVYQQGGRYGRTPYYQSIHGDEGATERYMSDRSVVKVSEDKLVAAFPRWYEKRNKNGEVYQHNIIEQVLLVEPDVVGAYASENGLLTGKLLSPHVDGDLVFEREQPVFGSIEVGKPESKVRKDRVPVTSQRLLVEVALNRPGEAQVALRDVIKELEHYAQTIPPEELASYKKKNAPEEITSESLSGLMYTLADGIRSFQELDRKLAQYVYSKGISIQLYFDTDARVEMQARSPEFIEISDQQVRVHYDKGQPYVTYSSHEYIPLSSEPVYLDDGREVLLQTFSRGRRKRLSFGDIKPR